MFDRFCDPAPAPQIGSVSSVWSVLIGLRLETSQSMDNDVTVELAKLFSNGHVRYVMALRVEKNIHLCIDAEYMFRSDKLFQRACTRIGAFISGCSARHVRGLALVTGFCQHTSHARLD